jgi:biopolymer transport protein TolQ
MNAAAPMNMPFDPRSDTTGAGRAFVLAAVVAYDRYAHDIGRAAIRFESFIEAFSSIPQRQER